MLGSFWLVCNFSFIFKQTSSTSSQVSDMESLRNFLKGWMGKALLILFLLPLAITGFESIVRSGDDPNAVAKVADLNVDNTTLQNMINQRRETLLEQVKGDASLLDDSALREQMLHNLIDRYLIINQASQLGFTVSDATITQMLMTEKAFLDANGKFSNDLFAEYLNARHMTKAQLFDSLRQDLMVSAFSRGIINTGIFAQSGVDQLIAMQSEARPLSVARLDWHTFAPQVQISAQEIANYYQKNQASLKSSEMVDLNYLTVDKTTLPVAPVTAQELQQQYQSYLKENQQQTEYELAMILMNSPQAQTTLTTLKAKLDANQADFATLAKQYSEDEGSKNDGGNIGPISAAMFPNDYDNLMNTIKGLQVGQVTNPIKTAYGYHLFKLVKIGGQTPPSLQSLAPVLTEQVNTQKREAAYQDLIGKINNDAVAGATLTELANRYKITAKTLKNFSKTDNTTALNQPAIIAAAFDHLALQENSVSVGIETGDQVVWLQPTHHRPSKNLSQTEAQPIILAKLTEQKAKALALAQAQAIANKVQQTNNLQSAGIGFQQLGTITRQDPKLSDDERGAAFAQTTTGAQLSAIAQSTAQGASVIVGGAIVKDQSQITAEVRQQTAQIVRENIGQSQFEDYLAYLRSITKVTIKPQATVPN